jgi:hypothetical protein
MPDNTELNFLIVRNIGDIEAAMKHAVEELGPRIWDEVGKSLVAVHDAAAWFAFSDAEDEEIWLAYRSWLTPDAVPADADFWIGLDERTSFGNDGENSWLATFTASGPNGATTALWIDQNILGKVAWKKLVKANGGLIDELRSGGFSLDEDDDRRLYLPLVIDREALATAFESEDFDLAMRPVVEAYGKVVDALPQLQRLRELAQEAA